MIKGICVTNIDDYKRETWPTEFVAVPQKGECVCAKSGKFLRVARVTHTMGKDIWATEGGGTHTVFYPMIEVELMRVI